ncbi:MAG: hypothetical protein EXS59_02410 [Candidatus Taylorbacteria bacterium]|nr:hypothetical protein [Candidatus Taylorbacteria bacterium]
MNIINITVMRFIDDPKSNHEGVSFASRLGPYLVSLGSLSAVVGLPIIDVHLGPGQFSNLGLQVPNLDM